MEFDVFDKLSELETKIQCLRAENEAKSIRIQELEKENEDLRRQMANVNLSSDLNLKNISVEEAPPGMLPVSDTTDEPKSDLLDLTSGKSIADALKETSETAVQGTGYVFDSKTGLYYDHISGYYYDPENQLFYEPRSGVYYSYNTETREYSYHSRANQQVLKQQYDEFNSQPAVQHAVKKLMQSPKRSPSRRSRTKSRSLSRSRRRRSKKSKRRSYTSSSASTTSSSRHRRKRSGSTNSSHYRRKRSYKRHKRHRSRQTKYRSSSSRSASSDSVRSNTKAHKKSKTASSCQHDKPRRSKHNDASDEKLDSKCRSSDERQSKDKEIKESVVATNTCVAARPVIYPPSVRLVVLSSKCLPVGRLGILTHTQALSGWGTLGRTSSTSEVMQFDEHDVEPIHCEIVYSRGEQKYFLKDRRSAAGTYVNGTCLQPAERSPLAHGDIVRIGSTRLLVHIHPGRETCNQCEVNEFDIAKENADTVASATLSADRSQESLTSDASCLDPETAAALKLIATKEEELSFMESAVKRGANRQTQLNHLRSKYGLVTDPQKRGRGGGGTGATSRGAFTTPTTSLATATLSLGPNYVDRAAQRRAQEREEAVQLQAAAVMRANAALSGIPMESGSTSTGNDNSDALADQLALQLPVGARLLLPKPSPAPASVHRPLGEENKGAQLLAKMGWRAGEGLGKDKSGIAEPVSVGRRLNQHAGLGSAGSGAAGAAPGSVNTVLPLDATPNELEQARRRATTLMRYQQLEQKQSEVE